MYLSLMQVEWIVAAVIYLAVLLYGFRVSIRMLGTIHGGKYATATPYLLVAVGVLFMMQAIFAMFQFVAPSIVMTETFQFGGQILIIISGIFFIKAFYQVYQMAYATSMPFSK